MSKGSIKAAIQEFLRTGDHDPLFLQFPGNDHLDRIRGGHCTLVDALLAEMQTRASTVASSRLAVLPTDIQAFSRQKVEPMVRGLFKRVDQESVIMLLESSVVFITPDSAPLLIKHDDLHTAWLIANLYLRNIGAEPISAQSPPIVGFSANTTCYVSMAYFEETCPFADYVVHEAAHVFHYARRRDAGLRGRREDAWLLPIDFRKRETFAYASEAYSRICELADGPQARRSLLDELKLLPPPPDERVDAHEYTALLTKAVARRNGWKAILEWCSVQKAG